MNNSSLRNYDEEFKLYENHKAIIKIAIFVVLFFLLVSGILTYFFNNLYTLIVGELVGGIVSCSLFIITGKFVIETNQDEYLKVTKKIHMIYQITYFISFLSLALIFRDFYVVIALVIGLLTIKMAIIIWSKSQIK